jgi:hypothetical protein
MDSKITKTPSWQVYTSTSDAQQAVPTQAWPAASNNFPCLTDDTGALIQAQF